MNFLVAFISILVVLGIFLLFLANYLESSTGMPRGKVIQMDFHHLIPESKPLYDPIRKLTGRPDYLVKNNKNIIPVEIKKGQQVIQPHESHIYQLAAYLSLVESTYGKRPSFGILHYKDIHSEHRSSDLTYAINNTPQMQKRLNKIIQEMRKLEQREQVMRSHHAQKRCFRCGYRTFCDQRL